MSLINIAADGQTPLFIPTTGITGLFARGTYLTVATKDGTLVMQETAKLLPIRDIAKMLEDAGNPLHAFHATYTDTGNQLPLFLAPSAVDFMTVSTADADDRQCIIIGVQGLGYLELPTYTSAQITELADLVAKEKTFLSFAPEKAYARWHQPKSLYLAPQELTHMTFDGRHQLMVYFKSGSLDVQSSHLDWDQRNKHLDTAANRVIEGYKDMPLEKLTIIFRNAQQKFREKMEVRECRAGKKLARELAQHAPHLIEIDGMNMAFIQPAAIGHIYTHQKEENGSAGILLRTIQETGKQYPETFQLQYWSVAERDAAMVKLAKDMAPKSLTAKPPSPKAP